MLLIVAVFVASAATTNSQGALPKGEISGITDSNSKDIQIPNFGKHTFEELKKSPSVSTTKGKIPQYATQTERQNWLGKLDKTRNIVATDIDMNTYLHPKGPVIEYGWNIDGYFEVILYKDMNVTDSQISEIYNVINRGANKAGIQEIPVVFVKKDLFKDLAASGYDTKYPPNPVIGAIQLACNGYYGTLSFAAKKSSDGTIGYVTVQHLGQNIGDQMYQPNGSIRK